MTLFIAAFVILLSAPSWATTYYVSKTASNGYAVGSDANNCTQAQDKATPKSTIWGVSGAKVCMVGGDWIIVNEGTYTEEILNPPAGTASAYTTIYADPISARPLLRPDGVALKRGLYCSNGVACAYIRLEGFDISGGYNNIKLATPDAATGYPHHVQIVNNVLHDSRLANLETNTSTATAEGGDHLIQGNTFYNTGIHNPGYAPGYNTIYNPGNRSIVERNTFRNLHNGVGIWTSGRYIYDVIVRHNLFYDIGLVTTDTWLAGASGYSCIHVGSSGGRHRIYDNICINSGEDADFRGINVNPQFGKTTLTDVQIYNNTIYNVKHASAYGIRASTNMLTPGGALVKNNLVIPIVGTAINDASGVGAMVQTTNRTSGTPGDLWTNVDARDFTLKAGSAAIDAGTDVGLQKCGNLPDQGAFEVCGFSSASITGSTLDVTMENIYPPLQVFGPAGWSVSCTPNPDACGTPSVVGASLVTGSGAIARLTIAGIANENCTADQIFTVSFDDASGDMSDYILLGGQTNQFAHSFTGRAVTNQCTGSGGTGPPAGVYIYYPLDGNANDSSGGNRHATTSGTSFVDAKYSQGMKTDPGENDYAELPYLNGVNPSTQSLTVAFGVYVPAADLSKTRDVFGTPSGTDQRFFLWRHSSNNWRMAIQDDSGSATEFSVMSGWNFVCVTLNAGTDTATLAINGVTGQSSGTSVQAYTSYTLAGNGRIGLPSGFATSLGGNHTFDEFRLYQSVVSCADLYAAWEPPTSSWTGTISTVSTRIYGAKTDWLGAVMPQAAVDTNIAIAPSGVFTYAGQIDCTVADCTAISYKLYYTCAACPSAGASLVVPETATSDEIEMFGSISDGGLLTGAHGANLSGALTHLNGTTLLTSTAAAGPDLAQNNSTVHRAIVRFTTAATVGRQYCFKWREQSGLALNSYTPSGGVCVTVGAPAAAAGF